MNIHAFRELQLLERISSGGAVTQRGLAKTSGLALGLTNLLIKRLVTKGCVKVVNLDRKRLRYHPFVLHICHSHKFICPSRS